MESSIHDYQDTYEQIADKILNFAQENIAATGNLVDKKIKAFGNIAEEILKQTKKEDYELLILGSHGKKGIKSWLGSVSREVINTTKKNIFISKNRTENKNILFTTDGSEYSLIVIKKALDLLDMTDCSIFTIHVEKDINNVPVELKNNPQWINQIKEQQEQERNKISKELCKVFKEKNLLISREINLIGDPAEKILELNSQMNFDLIVMGSHSKNIIQRFILGSTSMRVLERAKNSVMILSPKANRTN